MKKKLSIIYGIICGIISVQIILSGAAFATDYGSNEINGTVNQLLSYQKSKNNGKVYSPDLVGTNAADWFAVGCARSGNSFNYEDYSNEIINRVNLSTLSSAELNRISLSVSANGGNPRNFANSNLITDGIYGHSPSNDGVNGWIWSLIAIDSREYSIPNNVPYSRDDIIVEIIRQQLDNGGFAQTGTTFDTSVTALAITALSPYINHEYTYSFTSKSGNKTSKTVKNVIDESVAKLSEIQNSDGTFSPSSVSTAHAIIALCSVGINPNTDLRFVKSGGSALDGLMKYRLNNGGFAYSSTASGVDDYASSQALLALSAYKRLINHQRRVFDFSSEFSANSSSTIQNLNSMLSTFTSETITNADIHKLQELYNSLSSSERTYIYEYAKIAELSAAVKNSAATEKPKNSQDIKAMAKYTKVPSSESLSLLAEKALAGVKLQLEKAEERANNLDTVFTENDRKKLAEISNTFSTKYYYTVLNLINKAEKCEQTEEIETIKSQLYEQKKIIETLITEIEDINSEITKSFPSFDKVSVSKREKLQELNERIAVLDDYDKQKIKNYDEFNKTVEKINSIHTTIIISIVAVQLLVVVSAIVIFTFKRNNLR